MKYKNENVIFRLQESHNDWGIKMKRKKYLKNNRDKSSKKIKQENDMVLIKQ